jgi:hypothetical protein
VAWDRELRTSSISNSIDNSVTATTTENWMFVDSTSNNHLIGAENNVVSAGSFTKQNFYLGFIWQICVYANYNSQFGPLLGGPGDLNECNICPSDKDLIDCAWNEYRDPVTFSCDACDPECLQGCQMVEHCNVCIDEQCNDCPQWSDCTDCIENAEFNA